MAPPDTPMATVEEEVMELRVAMVEVTVVEAVTGCLTLELA